MHLMQVTLLPACIVATLTVEIEGCNQVHCIMRNMQGVCDVVQALQLCAVLHAILGIA